jgi:hypothetical protein
VASIVIYVELERPLTQRDTTRLLFEQLFVQGGPAAHIHMKQDLCHALSRV